jgi:hypothetical protein
VLCLRVFLRVSSEKQSVYISEDAAFGNTGIFQSGFTKAKNVWHAAYVCESETTGVTSAEHVVKFNLKKDGRIGGHLDLMGRRDGRVEIVGQWSAGELNVEVQCGKGHGNSQGLLGNQPPAPAASLELSTCDLSLHMLYFTSRCWHLKTVR